MRAVAFSPDGTMIASGSGDRTIHLWETKTGNKLKVLEGHNNIVRSVAFSYRDGQTLVSGSDDETIKLWNVASGTCLKTLRAERIYERVDISHVTGLTDAQKASLKILGAIDKEE